MKLSEAIAALEAGKKIRKKDWKAGNYVYLNSGNFLLNESGGYWCINIDVVDYDRWELYEESGHDFQWALEQLKAFKDVRRKIWVEGRMIGSNALHNGFASYADMIAADWELA